MKINPSFSFIICLALLITNVHAQNTPALRDVSDPQLQQLIKQHKNIRFVTTADKGKPVVQFYEEPEHTAPANALQPNTISASAAKFHLTKDINVQTDANPANNDFIFNRPYAMLNDVLYFSANDGIHGNELWRSDGTAGGTYLVKDLLPGAVSSNPHEIIVANNKLFFVTQSYISYSFELWTSDGTPGGTVLLKELYRNGPGIGSAYNLTNVSGKVYFFLSDPFNTALQLWKTDGTANGTVLVKDYQSYIGAPFEHTGAQGLFYFTLSFNSSGYELWRSDGTDAGTFMVKDIAPDPNVNGPLQLTPFNKKLYFSADDGTGRKLWLTDGTTTGTTIANGANSVTLQDNFYYAVTNEPFAVQDSSLYMQGTTQKTGSELYKYDVATGFYLVKDITRGSAGGYINTITPAFGGIAFNYFDTVNHKTELWESDGSARTLLLKSYDAGTGYFDYLTPGNALLYFISRDSNGNELWKTNGTPAGTTLVKDIYAGTTSSYPADLTYFKNKLYFNAASKKAGTELWQSYGTAGSTSQVAEINQVASSSSGPNYYGGSASGNVAGSAIGNTLYFNAYRPETGNELYQSDGTGPGTVLKSDLVAGENGSYPMNFTKKHGAVYFIASVVDSVNNYSYTIFKTDSAGNTTPKTFLSKGFIISYDVADNGLVYYILYSFLTGKYELWRGDGTLPGNFMLTDKLASFNYTYTVKTLGNKAFFSAADENGTELWSSNGTIAGTKIVRDINTGSNSGNPYSLYVYKNNIYFGADNGAGIALWRSNGTAVGTLKIKTIQPYGLSNNGIDYNNYFCLANGELYMNAYTSSTGAELWKTNGTGAGTVLVKDITGDATDGNPSFLTDVNGSVFFSVANSQLWKSDGTAATTALVKNIFSSDFYLLFRERCVADGKLFFNTNQLLWVSDGTDAGTQQVADNGLNGVNLVTNLAAAGNAVFFNGYADNTGYELYSGDATQVMPHIAGGKPQVEKRLSFTAVVLQNPVNNVLGLQVKSESDQVIIIAVSNALGNIIAQQKITVSKGANRITIPAGNWQTGVYVVKLYNSAAETVSISVLK